MIIVWGGDSKKNRRIIILEVTETQSVAVRKGEKQTDRDAMAVRRISWQV